MQMFLVQNNHICVPNTLGQTAGSVMHVTSHFGYLVLLITRTFLSGPLRFEITSVDCIILCYSLTVYTLITLSSLVYRAIFKTFVSM